MSQIQRGVIPLSNLLPALTFVYHSLSTPELRECERCVCVCVYSGNLPSLLMALVYTGNIETPLGWNFSLMAKCCLSSARLVAWLLLLVFKMTMLRTPDALEYGCVVYKFKFLPVWIVGSC